MLPAVAVMLTLPRASSTLPTVTSVAASSLACAVDPVLKNTLVALCVIEPVPATTSMLPLVAPLLVVRMSAVPVKLTLRPASTLTLPVPLTMSAFTTMSVPLLSDCSSTLPLPFARIAVSSAGAVPSFKVIAPLVVRITIDPLPPVVTTSDCATSVTASPVAPTG